MQMRTDPRIPGPVCSLLEIRNYLRMSDAQYKADA